MPKKVLSGKGLDMVAGERREVRFVGIYVIRRGKKWGIMVFPNY